MTDIFDVHFLGKENKIVTKRLQLFPTQHGYEGVVYFIDPKTHKQFLIGTTRIICCEEIWEAQ